MIFAVLDVSLIIGLNIGETDSFFYINIIIILISFETPSRGLEADLFDCNYVATAAISSC